MACGFALYIHTSYTLLYKISFHSPKMRIYSTLYMYLLFTLHLIVSMILIFTLYVLCISRISKNSTTIYNLQLRLTISYTLNTQYIFILFQDFSARVHDVYFLRLTFYVHKKYIAYQMQNAKID